jgi:hypothetical protein
MQSTHRTPVQTGRVVTRIVSLLRKDNSCVSTQEIQAFCRAFAGELPEHAQLYYQALFNLGVSGKSVSDLIATEKVAWIEALLIGCREYTGVVQFVVSSK